MWSVVSSRYALHDQWIRVREDACVTASGALVSPYYTLEYPDFVHVLAFTANHQLVLTRQYRHGLSDYTVELPGGMMNESETDPVSAGMRELQEETGFLSTNRKLLATLSVDPAKLHNRLHLVVASDVVKASERSLDMTEDIEVLVISVGECLDMVKCGRFMNAAHIGLLMLGLEDAGMIRCAPRTHG